MRDNCNILCYNCFMIKTSRHKGLAKLFFSEETKGLPSDLIARNRTIMRAVHPGEILREDILPGANISESKLAEYLNVSRMTVNRLVNERQGISAEMALRLGKLFGNSPDFWLNLQSAYDLKVAEHSVALELDKIEPLLTATRT